MIQVDVVHPSWLKSGDPELPPAPHNTESPTQVMVQYCVAKKSTIPSPGHHRGLGESKIKNSKFQKFKNQKFQATIEAWEKTHDEWHDSLAFPATRYLACFSLVKSFASLFNFSPQGVTETQHGQS